MCYLRDERRLALRRVDVEFVHRFVEWLKERLQAHLLGNVTDRGEVVNG
jgi:hypothetical protein